MSSFGGKKRIVPLCIGTLVGIILTVIAANLLMQADVGMELLMNGWIGGLRFGTVLGYLLRAVIVTLLFYSLYHHALFGKPRTVREIAPNWPLPTLGIAVCMLLILYTVYVSVQFRYLFGARLPAGMTYADYAREGFAQLIAVSCINFFLFGMIERFTARSVCGTVLQTMLLIATALILGSALVRLLMYIGAYGLTMMRVLPLWAMIYLAVMTLMCAARIKRRSMPLVRICAIVLLYWYAALTLVPWDLVIAHYNAVRFGLNG